MITAVARKSEQEYRAGEADSSSTLKDFVTDRKKYYKKYILKESVEEDEETKATTIGSLVDCLLLDHEHFDNKFHLSTGLTAPTEKMMDFVNALYKQTMASRDDNGVVNKEFIELARDAYTESGYKLKFETVIDKFTSTGANLYYEEILKVRPRGLIIITDNDIRNAESIVGELKTSEYTADIVNQESNDSCEVFNQIQIENIELKGLLLKGMMDKVMVWHSCKEIDIYDLKCVWSLENFYEDYYLYRKAYIQMWVYYGLVSKWAESRYPGYIVNLPQFIVCDSSNYYKPLIYKSFEEDLEDAYKGFYYKGKFYKGTMDIIEDLKWAKEHDEWRVCREASKTNGIVSLKRLN